MGPTAKRFRKNRKISLLHPVDEEHDLFDSEDEEILEPHYPKGGSDIALYKCVIERCHKKHREKTIGAKTKSEFFLSLKKFH
jgi:hypothetical protein